MLSVQKHFVSLNTFKSCFETNDIPHINSFVTIYFHLRTKKKYFL